MRQLNDAYTITSSIRTNGSAEKVEKDEKCSSHDFPFFEGAFLLRPKNLDYNYDSEYEGSNKYSITES
jgi:hypothetical protein